VCETFKFHINNGHNNAFRKFCHNIAKRPAVKYFFFASSQCYFATIDDAEKHSTIEREKGSCFGLNVT
jgi:hypothetical protein